MTATTTPTKRPRGRPRKIETAPKQSSDFGEYQPVRQGLASGDSDKPDNKSQPDASTDDAELVRETLRAICRDGSAPPAARAQAARTLAEMSGALGRFAKPLDDDRKPVGEMSRTELEAELARL